MDRSLQDTVTSCELSSDLAPGGEPSPRSRLSGVQLGHLLGGREDDHRVWAAGRRPERLGLFWLLRYFCRTCEGQMTTVFWVGVGGGGRAQHCHASQEATKRYLHPRWGAARKVTPGHPVLFVIWLK